MMSGGKSGTKSRSSSYNSKQPINKNGYASSSNGGIFITEDGGITLPSFCWLIGMPLLLSGRILYGVITIIMGLVFAVRKAMDAFIQEEERHELRYNVLHPDDILAELEDLETSIVSDDKLQGHQQQPRGTTSHTSSNEVRLQCTASLMALAKKFNQKQSPDNLPLLAQQASYICLRLYPDDDEVVTGSISLLALVAKDGQVRNRHKYQKEDYGLKLPVSSIRKALQRAQNLDENDEDREEQLAELQRKGCLWLGALADTGNSSASSSKPTTALATLIVEEDGLETIIDAANWFRYHDGVLNWALWATFILCYDDATGTFCKARLVQLGGINTICTSLKNIPDSLEVNRHGIAILFDLLRQHDEQQQSGNSKGSNTSISKLDPWEIRKVALASGLHDVVKNAMIEFSDSMDIMMMGQEMLIGTGYRGDIPQYQQL